MKSFVKNTLISLAVITSCASAANNGYWGEREICDNKTVTERTPVTMCFWNGNIMLPGVPAQDRYKEYSQRYEGVHKACETPIYRSVRVGGSSGTPGYSVSGTFHLSEEEHTYVNKTTVVKDENSCRVERFWVECDGPESCE